MSGITEIKLPKISARFASGHATTLTGKACSELAIEKPLLVGTANSAQRYSLVWDSLDAFSTTTFFRAEPHCPIAIVEACREEYLHNECDGVVAIGGGSTLGLGKILAAEEQAKFIALPTTYSGSETTAIFGRKIDGQKKTTVNEACRPDIVIYDGALSSGLPQYESVTSTMNSIAHAAEALYPRIPNRLAEVIARDCLEAHAKGLEELVFGTDENQARSDLLYGGFLGGILVSMCGIALHHQLCHVIGGLFDLPHAETNSVILPQALAYNREFIPSAESIIADVFGGRNAGQAVFDFARKLGAPLSLQGIGMPESGIDQVVEAMLAHGGYNPRPLEAAALHDTIQSAFSGTRPS